MRALLAWWRALWAAAGDEYRAGYHGFFPEDHQQESDDMAAKKKTSKKKPEPVKPQHTGAVELHPVTGKEVPKHSEHS